MIPTETNTPDPSITPISSPTGTDTSEPTITPTLEDTLTPTLISSPTGTETPSDTPTPTETATITLTPTETGTPTNTPTITPSVTPSLIPSPTQPPVPVFSNAAFTYDGDGKRVKSVMQTNPSTGSGRAASTTTYFVGNYYEVTGTSITKYYYAGSQRIAMRKNNVLSYLISDHLGSTSMVTDSNGTVINQTKYMAWGETRYTTGTEQTKYSYTGQYSYTSDFGLMYYGARWYDSSLGRFAQADTIIPTSQGVQGYDRYAYVNNSPINYTDPSGRCIGLITCGLTALGILPDFQGIANVMLWTRTDNAVVAAGISVQSQFITGLFAGSGRGLAQLTSDEMKDFELEGSVYNPTVAVQGMEERIQLALDNCSACVTETDNLIVAALAQNGFDTRYLPTINESIDWKLVFSEWGDTDDFFAKVRQDLTGMKFGTQFMAKIYMQDLKILMSLGYDLPENFDDADFDLIDSYINPSPNPSGASAPNTPSGNGGGFNGLAGNNQLLWY